MGALSNEALQQDPSHLLLDTFILCFIEEEEHNTREVMCMTRRVSKLISDGVEANVPCMIIAFHQILKDFHFRSVAKTGSNLIILEASKTLHANIQDERVHFWGIQLVFPIFAKQRNHFCEEVCRLLVSKVAIQLSLESRQRPNDIR